MCLHLQREEEIRQILPRMLCDERRTRKLWRTTIRISHSVGDSLKCKFPNLLFTACSCRWPPTELSGPRVHHSSAAAVRPRPRAARRGPCPVDRPAVGSRLRVARRGPCPTDRPVALVAMGPQPRAAPVGTRSARCSADRLVVPVAAGPRPRAAPAGAGSARFAHNNLRPPFRIWWGQCSSAWHRG